MISQIARRLQSPALRTLGATALRPVPRRTAPPVFYRSFAAQAAQPAQAAPQAAQANYNAPPGEDPVYPSFLAGPFGTPEKPVQVPAVGDSRIVGCVGGPGKEHELIWHEVIEGSPLVCVECGQVFALRKVTPSGEGEGSAGHHH